MPVCHSFVLYMRLGTAEPAALSAMCDEYSDNVLVCVLVGLGDRAPTPASHATKLCPYARPP